MDDDPLGRHHGTMPRKRTRLWFLLSIFFGILLTIGIAVTSEPIYPGINTIIFEAISKNPFQVYEINTECELVEAIMDGVFYARMSEYYETIPDAINEIEQIAAEIKMNNSVATEEQKKRILELLTSGIPEYFSLNPDLLDTLIFLDEHPRGSLGWLDRMNSAINKCDLVYTMEDVYG